METRIHKQVSAAQIEYLYRFCKQHFVHHYDLQTELVDHLASAIEDIWVTNPQMPIEDAVVQVHKRFGVMGFATVVSERMEQLRRQNIKLRRNCFKQYFQWPKLALTLFIFALLYSIGYALPQAWLTHYCVSLIIGTVVWEFVMVIGLWQLQQRQVKKLMLTEAMAGETILSFIGLQVLVHQRWWQETALYAGSNAYHYLMIWMMVFVVGIMSYIDFVKAVHKLAKATYPEAFKTRLAE